MAQSSASNNIDNFVRVFTQNDDGSQKYIIHTGVRLFSTFPFFLLSETAVKHEHHEQWINNSIFFRQITQDIAGKLFLKTCSSS